MMDMLYEVNLVAWFNTGESHISAAEVFAKCARFISILFHAVVSERVKLFFCTTTRAKPLVH